MMENEQIQEMAEIAFEVIINGESDDMGLPDKITTQNIGKELYDTGYRKVERGEWMPYGMNMNSTVGNWKCSACNKTSIKPYNYCPNCGADMRGGKNVD